VTAQLSTSTRATRRVALLAAAGIGAVSMLAAIPADAIPSADSDVGLTVSTRAAKPANPKLKLSRVSGNKLKAKAKTRNASSVLFKYRAKTGSYKKRTIRVTNNKAVTVFPKNTRTVKARAKGKRTSAWVTIPNVNTVAPIKNGSNSNNNGGNNSKPEDDFFYGQSDWLYTLCNLKYEMTEDYDGNMVDAYDAINANGNRAYLEGIGTAGTMTGKFYWSGEMRAGEETLTIIYGPARDRFKVLRYHQDPTWSGGKLVVLPGYNAYYVETGVKLKKSDVCPSKPVDNRPEWSS
jgi:hypothetical protein